MYKASVVLFFVFYFINVNGQSTGIKGKVVDADDLPLIGATIAVNNTGTTTDAEGNFTLPLPEGEYKIFVTYIGYQEYSEIVKVLDNQISEFYPRLIPESTLLDAATVTGSKHDKTLSRSAVSINVIEHRLADNTNTTKISTLLDKVPGVQIIDNQANIRGGSGWSYGAGSRVLLLIDDIPALQGDAGRPSWGDIPVENISQVEVLKGASSTLYGSSALNGIINIRTGYATSEPVTKANVGYTYFMSPKDKLKQWWTAAPYKVNVGLLHKQKFGNLDVVANGYFEDYKSFYIDSYEQKNRASANLKYRVSDNISIGLNTMVNIGKAADHFIWRNGGAGIYEGLEGTYSERKYQRFYVDPQITFYKNEQNRHKVFGRYYYINNDNNNGQANASKTFYGEYQYLKKIENLNLDITAGVVGQLIKSESELLRDSTVDHNNFAQYIEFDKRFGKLIVTAGIRHEYHEQLSNDFEGGKDSESKLISRVGLNYELTAGTFLRSSWGQGYRYPTIVERFIRTDVGGFFIFPNPQLQSEFGWSSEIGVKQGYKFGGFKGYVDLSFFLSRYQDMTEFTLLEDANEPGSFGFQSINIGDTDIRGYEIELLSASSIGNVTLNVIAGYTYINPTYQDFENNELVYNSISKPVGAEEKVNILKYRTQHNFKIDAEAILENFAVGFAINTASETATIDQLLGNIGQIKLYREVNPGGYLKVDARMSYQFDWFKVSLLSENLLNEEYTLRPGLLEAPRSLAVRLDFNL